MQCKTYATGLGTYPDIGEPILRTFTFYFLGYSSNLPNLPPIPNLGANNAHAMALALNLTHPERCAPKLCARSRQKFLEIFRLRPIGEKHVPPKCPQNCSNMTPELLQNDSNHIPSLCQNYSTLTPAIFQTCSNIIPK